MLHVLAGAVIGAVVGGAASAIGSLVKGKPIDWKRVGAAAAGGAVAGSIASLTFGAGLLAGSAATQMTGMVAAGAVGGATEQVTDNVLHDEVWHEDVAESAAVGAAIGAAGGVLRVAAKPLAGLARSSAGRLAGAGRAVLKKQASAQARRWAGRLLKPVTEAAKRRAARALSPLVRAAQRRVLDPLQRRVLGPIARQLAPVFRPLQPVFRPFARAWDKYKQVLDKAPIRTKSATSSTIAMTGDVIAQAAEGRGEWDWKRTVFRGAFGALWSGPVGHHWFARLDKLVPGNTWGAVLAKIGIDQFLWAPISGSVFFGSYSMIYDGMTPAETAERIKQDLPRALKAQYMVWPAFHLFNFRYVPLNMRVPASATAGLGWSVFFSTLLSDDEADDEAAAREVDGALGAEASDPVVVSRPRAPADRPAYASPALQDGPPGFVEGFGPPVHGMGIAERLSQLGSTYAPGLMPQR